MARVDTETRPRGEAPAPKESVIEEEGPLGAAGPFPSVQIESIRWHPEPLRRTAVLTVASRRIPDAHEGDIISGVKIVEIRPGSVEVAVGEHSQRVELVP